jgi:hypothetical protein
MFEAPRFLSQEDVSQLKGKLPPHLRPFLFFANPYMESEDIWPKLPCFGAALSFYTRSLEGYDAIERAVLRSLPKLSDHLLLPTILDKAFVEVNNPSFGDMVVFYHQRRHIHAGISIGNYNGAPTVLSKANIGILPLLVDTQVGLARDFGADTVRYFAPIDRSMKLEDVLLPHK